MFVSLPSLGWIAGQGTNLRANPGCPGEPLQNPLNPPEVSLQSYAVRWLAACSLEESQV